MVDQEERGRLARQYTSMDKCFLSPLFQGRHVGCISLGKASLLCPVKRTLHGPKTLLCDIKHVVFNGEALLDDRNRSWP